MTPGAAGAYRAPDQRAVAGERVIRCVRCWLPLSDDDAVIRVPFAATGQPSVAHAGECPP